MAEILLIEDNPADIVLTKEAFKECRSEHHISFVNDGIEAMKFLKKTDQYSGCQTPDIILLDLNLPKKDGRQVLAEIRSDEKLKDIPVVVLSTSKNENDIYASYELNANCYISKPVELDSFFYIIEKVDKFWLNQDK